MDKNFFSGVRILFGVKPPKNWKENLKKQKDPEYQRMMRLWVTEKDPEAKQEIWKQAEQYWVNKAQ